MNRHDPTEILSALLDGEAIAPEELASVLARPGAADMLVDFASLRLALRESEEETAASPAPAVREGLGPLRRLAILAAAAALIVTTAAVTQWLSSGEPPGPPMVSEVEAGAVPVPSERLKVVTAGSRTTKAGEPGEKEEWL